MLRTQPRGIAWDLDHTLVGVAPSSLDRFASLPMSGDLASTLEARPGLHAALAELTVRGYTHYVTTGATRAYAERALRSAGIERHFAGIFPGDDIDVGLGKRYRPVARALGLSDEAARERMIVVGDVVYDQPADISGLVFLQQPDGFRQDARTVSDVIGLLEDLGAGSLQAGYWALYSAAREGGRQLRRLGGGYLTTIPTGATLYVERRSPHWQAEPAEPAGAHTIPTILLLTDEAIAYYLEAYG